MGHVARACDVHPKTVRLWVDKGRLEAIRSPSGQLRFDPVKFRAFLEGAGYPVPEWLRGPEGSVAPPAVGGV